MTLQGINIYYGGTKNPPEWQIAIFLLVVFLPAFVVMVACRPASSNNRAEK